MNYCPCLILIDWGGIWQALGTDSVSGYDYKTIARPVWFYVWDGNPEHKHGEVEAIYKILNFNGICRRLTTQLKLVGNLLVQGH